jgi:hypothetical protein
MSNILPAGTPAPDFTCMPRRTRRLCSRDCAADLLSWLFIQPIGARCGGTRWRSTTRSFRGAFEPPAWSSPGTLQVGSLHPPASRKEMSQSSTASCRNSTNLYSLPVA